jgi:hypothetical protein
MENPALVVLARCACCGQWRPVRLSSPAAFGARFTCGWCDLLTGAWFEREMARR